METPDTALDALAAQVKRHPPLPIETVRDLLGIAHGDPRGPAEATLIRHHLGVALQSALAHRDQGLDVVDLYQEASVAVVTAVEEYAARSTDADGLGPYVSRVVDLHVEAAIGREAAERESEEAFVRDSRLFEAVEIELRHRLGRPATTLELAAALEWPERRVELVSSMLADARTIHDEELVEYLDDDA